MKTLLVLLLLLGLSITEHIHDVNDNVGGKFGVAQEHRTTTCAERSHSRTPLPVREGDYDFIVVGGGSAGSVIASRLADSSPDVKVLLLESGKNLIDDSDVMNEEMKGILKTPYCVPGQTAESCSLLSLPLHYVETPFMVPYLCGSNSTHYFQTTPQMYGNKREIYYPRGKLIGGSSATNQLVAFRGHPEDYDNWAKNGLEGWSYKDLLPFMKRVETNHQYGDHSAHGNDGPIHTTNVSSFFDFPVATELLKTAWKMGYPKVEDFNKGYDYYGAGYWQQYSNDKGRRTSSYEYIRRMAKANRVCINGFISDQSMSDDLKAPQNNDMNKNSKKPCTSQQNLHIITEAFGTKLIVDKSGSKPRVVGVEYVNATTNSYDAIRKFPNYKEYSSENEKTRKGMEYWKADQRHEVSNCPVAESLAWDNTRSDEWYIPPNKALPQEEIRKVYAKREVILTSGTFVTPQLLMLSGIGPAKHLEHTLGFKKEEIVSDLPGIGRLLDHEEITVNFRLPKGVQHWGVVKDLLGETNKWVNGEKSVLGSNHAPAGMDISSEGTNGTEPTIHIHFIMLYFENLDLTMWKKQDAKHRVPAGLTDFAFYEGLQHYTTLIERSGTCSEGLLRLKSRNPLVQPMIDMNYGACDFSIKELIFGIKEVRKLNSLLPAELRGEEIMPGADYDTDDKLENYVRNMVWGHHASGTVPMGTCDDKEAAADNHGRVFGVDGVRVADASAFPTIPHGNILYSVYAVAERISDFIVKDNKLDDGQPSLLQHRSV